MTITKETVDINLDTIAANQLWNLYKKWTNKEIDINENIWKAQKFTNILISAPQVTETEVVNKLTVEKSDCFKTHLIRVPSLSTHWTVCMQINLWKSEMSWTPDYINLTPNYIINLSTHEVFKLVKEDSLN